MNMDRGALERLSKDELIALFLAQAEALARVTARVAELEAKLGQPPKTPDNSSMPPSKGQKATAAKKPAKPRKGHPGTARALAETPDRIVEALAGSCPHCQHALSPADQREVHAYDCIDLPPIKPDITRVHRHRGTCPCCHKGFQAPVPPGLEPGSPFGANLCALIVHLHLTQAISLERLVRLMTEVFGLTISQGAIVNILRRAEAPLAAAAEAIREQVRTAKVVASDETAARVCGETWWQWVLLSTTAVYHVIADSRAAAVVEEAMRGAIPEIWVADRYGGQKGHGLARQVCLAHLLRDAHYALDEGDTDFAPRLRMLLLRGMAIGRRRDKLKDDTLKRYKSDLERRLDRLLAKRPTKPAAKRLHKALCQDRDDLFRFITRRDVPYTNNACERALRPSVIFRKVIGCFRSVWGARTYAAAASVMATAKLNGKSAFQAIRDILVSNKATTACPA